MITKRQLEQRVNSIGSSDVAPLLGLDPFRTAGDVAIEKRDKIIPDIDTAAMQRGRRLEQSILGFAREKLGPIVRNQLRVVRDVPKLRTHIDAIVRRTGLPIEAKSSRAFRGEWDKDENRVPPWVETQATVHMMATESNICWVAAFLAGPFDYEMFEVKRTDDLVGIITRLVPAFWEDIVEGGTELTSQWYRKLGLDVDPERLRPSYDMMRLMRRVPEKVVRIDPELAVSWHAAQEESTRIENHKKALRDEIVRQLGDAEAGLFEEKDESGSTIVRAVTFFQRSQAIMRKVGEKQTRVPVFRPDGSEWADMLKGAENGQDGGS